MMEEVRRYIHEQKQLHAGERVAVACSGGADSVALLRVLLQLREELGIVVSVAHFHHGIRGPEADTDAAFVRGLAQQFDLPFHSGSGDVPSWAEKSKISLETAARELRHQWFAQLLQQGHADKIATAHTLDDQAETVLMRLLRGTGVRGLAGIAPEQTDKHLVRPLLATARSDIQKFLNSIGQTWRDDSSNQDQAHTRNRVRHLLLPLLEREFNPAIRHTLADLAELARSEEDFWDREISSLLPKLLHEGKPSRSGRTLSGQAGGVVALDLVRFRALPLAVQQQVLYRVTERFGVTLEHKHIQQLTNVILAGKPGKTLVLPADLKAITSHREIQFSRSMDNSPKNYQYSLEIPGEVKVAELGFSIRARVISAGKPKGSEYNEGSLLNRTLLAPRLTVRNWRAGDRYFPAHSQFPKKVKELLQPSRLGKDFSAVQRKTWPVIESNGQIVWMRGFPVPEAFQVTDDEAVLIEETKL